MTPSGSVRRSYQYQLNVISWKLETAIDFERLERYGSGIDTDKGGTIAVTTDRREQASEVVVEKPNRAGLARGMIDQTIQEVQLEAKD